MKKMNKIGLLTLAGIVLTQIWYFTSELNIIFSTILMFIGIGCTGALGSMYQAEIRNIKRGRK